MASVFPFSALVGQEALRRALLLGVIQPSLGGVLVRGTKGVAKSTAVRALAAILPSIETVAGCPFQRRPGEAIADWPLDNAHRVVRAVPLVELPLGATEDRVLGTLHLERALRGERAFEPGLLASANRGILYIDEVNLLPDYLVDVLLDAAAGGVHHVERDGLSLSHPARFLLVGTMNPEEGELRPQLLDRFGLAVDVADLADPAARAEAVRRRLAFEADPAGFAALWQAADAAEAERIATAQRLLPEVHIAPDILAAITLRCLEAGVEGLRADLTLCKAACAWAAYQGRRHIEPADVDAVAELALAHRRTVPPEPPEPPQGRPPATNGASTPSTSQEAGAAPPSHMPRALEQVFDSAGRFAAQQQPLTAPAGSVSAGRWRAGQSFRAKATPGRPKKAHAPGARLAWAATLRAAAPQQRARGRSDHGPMILHGSDLRWQPRHGPAGCLLLFVVDSSGSMAAWRRMRQTKAAVLTLLHQAYQRRDAVALLVFRGRGAEVVLPATRGLAAAQRCLAELPTGGVTPLAAGLAETRRFLAQHQRRQRGQAVWTVVFTDGRGNIGAWRDVLAQAKALAQLDTEILVVDTETGFPRFGQAGLLAQTLGADCVSLDDVLGKPLRRAHAS